MLMEYDQTNIIEYVPFDRQIFPWTHHDPIPIFWFDQDSIKNPIPSGK